MKSSYTVKPGNIFGRIGTGFGQGASEQIPKEVENYRRQQGLREVGQKKGLDPYQQFTELAGVYGVTPQMVQTGGELLKQRETFGNFRNRQSGQERGRPFEPTQGSAQTIANVPFAATQQRGGARNELQQAADQQPGQPQINENNPLRPEAQPAIPWSAQRRYDEIDMLHHQFPSLSLPEVEKMASENEARELAQPTAHQARDEYLQKQQDLLKGKFEGYLSKELQKDKEGIYKDITGEMLNNAQRVMERELRSNPKASADDVAFNMAKKLGILAKVKNQFNSLADRTGLSNIFHKDDVLNKLKQYQKIFSETGNLEEYKNNLIEKFKMSPQGAASVAYPVSKNVSEKLGKTKNFSINNRVENSQKAAIDIEDYLGSNDSLLSIAKTLSDHYPYFDQGAFFNQLAQDQDTLRLNPRQRQEIAEGVNTDMVRSWGDIFILPLP